MTPEELRALEIKREEERQRANMAAQQGLMARLAQGAVMADGTPTAMTPTPQQDINLQLQRRMAPASLQREQNFMRGMQEVQAATEAQEPRNVPQKSLLGSIGSFFGDRARDPAYMARLSAGLQSMTLNPNQQFIQSQMQRAGDIQAARREAQQANVTAQYFRQQGQPQIADLIESVPGIGAEALKTLFREPAKTPSILQEYLFAVSQNPELTYEQFLNLKESGTTVNIPPPDVAGEAAMKQLPVAFKEVTDTGANARAQLNAIGQLGRALSGIETGGFAETKKSLLGLADRLGVQVDTDELGRLQAVDAIASQLVAAELRQNKGPQTDFDARFTQTFLPGLGQQKSANEAIISYMNSRNLRDALIGTYASANRRFDANDVNVMRNVNIIRQTVGSVIYKDNDPVTLEEFVSANRAAGKSDSEILLDWYAEHNPRGAAAMRGVQ